MRSRMFVEIEVRDRVEVEIVEGFGMGEKFL